MSSIRQARLRTTPFSHAFRPRFAATPKPRLFSATSFSHAFRPCLPTCHSDRGRCVFVTAMFQAPLSDTFILDLIDDEIDKHEGLITDVHFHIANRRHGINMSTPRRLKPFHRQRVFAPGCQYSEPHYAGDMTSETNPRHHRNCSQKSPNHNEALAFARAAPTQVGAHHLVELKADEMSKRIRSRI